MALRYQVASVCILPYYLGRCTEVKPAGGIRDLDTELAVRALGATRIGCTRTAEILEEARRQLG